MLFDADSIESDGTTDASLVNQRGMVGPNANNALTNLVAEDNVASHCEAFSVYWQYTDDDGAERALFVVTDCRHS